jgi:FMN reductase
MSKSRALLERAQEQLESAGWTTSVIDLASVAAEGLLGRRPDDNIRKGIEAVVAAQIIVASSPTYRATYTGLLKTFFDLLPQDCLAGKIGLPILTGGGPWHQLALDHGFRPLFASLGATVVNGVYGYDAQFKNGPDAALLAKVDAAVEEAVALGMTSTFPSPVKERGQG